MDNDEHKLMRRFAAATFLSLTISAPLIPVAAGAIFAYQATWGEGAEKIQRDLARILEERRATQHASSTQQNRDYEPLFFKIP